MPFRRPSALAVAVLIALAPAASVAYQQIELLREVGEPGKKPAQRMLNEPRAVALAGDRVYLADSEANRIVVLSPEGAIVTSWGAKGDQPGQFRSPSGIVVDAQGTVYVTDRGNGRIQVFSADGKHLRSFGTKGSGPKQFDGPAGLATAQGLLYVADTGNGRVQVLTVEGIYLASFTYQVKKEEMKAPVDVAVDAQNRVYVLDSDMNRVRVFSPAGELLSSFGAAGKGTDGFDEPLGLAIDDRGNIFVADTGNGKIKKFDCKGKLLGAFGSEGIGPGQFRRPAGIKVDGEGRAYIADMIKGTVQVIQIEVGDLKPLEPASPPASVVFVREIPVEAGALALDKRLWVLAGDTVSTVATGGTLTFGGRGSEPSRLKNPRGIALDATGNIWIADTGNDRLQKFNADGNLLQVIGRSGSGEGELRSPSGVAVSPKGNLMVADTGNRRVQVFSPKGVFLGAFSTSGRKDGQFKEPVAVAVDSSDNIYIVDRGSDRIMKHDSAGNQIWAAGRSGKLDGEFSAPESIVVSPDGEIYVLDGENCRVQVFDGNGKFLRAFGSEGRGPGEFQSPAGMVLQAGTQLTVGDRGNRRLQVFNLRHTSAVPADLAAQPKMNEVQLGWKPSPESIVEAYKVYRADAPGAEFKLLAATKEPFYLDRGLPSNRAFRYRVAAQARGGNESALSAEASALTPRLVPSTPRNVRLDASEKQITLSWLPNREPFVSHYRVFRTKVLSAAFEPIAKTDRPVFVDSQLDDESLYYYQVAAVGREGDESAPTEVAFAATPKAPLTAPPVDIARIEVREIFASAYKHYESHALGRVVLRNNTDGPAAGVKLTFSIKDYMDFPTDVAVPEIGPRQEVDLLLKPVFNNRILEVTENTPLQSEVALTFFAGGEARTIRRSFPVTLYERHAMTWDRKTKIGAFVTPKDPPVADFARGTVQPYVDQYPNLHPSLVYGRALYAALGVEGLSYIVDPTSPFQEFSEKSTVVDYLQYPRDTLARKSGDCDDLTVLFAAALENVGIPAALVDVPGHVFLIFSTGVAEAEKGTLGFPDTLFVTHRGTVWVPLEMTMVGASFTRAWQKGAEEYRDWAAKGQLEIIEVQKAWEEFSPVTLPPANGKTVKVKAEEIEAKYRDELAELGRQRLAYLSAEYLAALKRDPEDARALSQLGILYGENGMHNEALEQFQKLLSVDKGNALALNNMGNIYFLQDRLEDAQQAYQASLKAEPGDVGIMVNLSRILQKRGKKAEAKQMLLDAAAIDPRVVRQFSDLAAELGAGK